MDSIKGLENITSKIQELSQGGNLKSQVSGFAEGLFDLAKTGSSVGTDFSKSLIDATNRARISEPHGSQVEVSQIQLSRSGGVPSMGDLAEGFLDSVSAKGKASRLEAQKILTGESNNIHQAMIAGQEAGVAFSLMVEVRNKLVESYKELMRMQA